MLAVGFLGLLVGLLSLVILFALGRVFTLEIAFIRLAWAPVAALALQATLWGPMTRALGYAAIAPPLVTCLAASSLASSGRLYWLGGHARSGIPDCSGRPCSPPCRAPCSPPTSW